MAPPGSRRVVRGCRFVVWGVETRVRDVVFFFMGFVCCCWTEGTDGLGFGTRSAHQSVWGPTLSVSHSPVRAGNFDKEGSGGVWLATLSINIFHSQQLGCLFRLIKHVSIIFEEKFKRCHLGCCLRLQQCAVLPSRVCHLWLWGYIYLC
ncbi:hypothetical protein BS78_05G263300 [Paspalum vaginatum]|nr:hypothetical protein BS78_05G263300 [Paspalum vaginatum]